jgi:uncharacterized protein DUF4350
MSRRAILRALLVLTVLGLCAAWFFSCFEKREVEIETGVSAEARRNPYLALGRLLERMGHTVVFETNPARLAELPAPPATLILPTSRASIGAERSQALLDWVSRGGHLAVVTYSLWGESEKATEKDPELHAPRPDPILDRFGLRQWPGLPPLPEHGENGLPKAPIAPAPPSFEDLIQGKLPEPKIEASWAAFDGIEPLEVGFSPDFRWLDPQGAAQWSVAGFSGVHLIELRHGLGRISAFTSEDPLVNRWIAQRDNAEFAVRWLRRDENANGPIWIFYEEDWPSLVTLVREHALPALIAGAVLLSAWVWSTVFRFGPVLPEPPRARRAWLEHLEAAGRFHWRQDRGQALLAGMREEVTRRLREHHPGWRALSERERCARIAEHTGVPLDEVEHALAVTPSGARSFAASVSALERICAAL